MSAAPARLARLVRRVRNRLWRAEIARAGVWGLRITAAFLLVGALLRWRLGQPTLGLLALLAALALLLALLVGLARRPAWGVALATADQRAGADALLVTACGLPLAPQGVEALVLRRALRALPVWERQVHRRGGVVRLPLLPLAVMLAAAPLLALPPATSGPPAVADGLEAGRPTSPETSLAAVVEQLRQAAVPADAAPTSGRSPAAERTDGAPPVPVPPGSQELAGEAGPGAASRMPSTRGLPGRAADETAGAGPETGAAASGGSGRDVAGTGAGQASPNSPPRPVPRLAAERQIELQRLGATEGGAPGSGGRLDAEEAEAIGAALSAPPAVAPAQGPPGGGDFGIAQRSLIARYFTLRRNAAGQ